MGQRPAGQETHHNKRRPKILIVVFDRNDVGVLERVHRPNFSGEPLYKVRVPQKLLFRHLDNNGHTFLRVPGPVGNAHAPLSQLGDDPVPKPNKYLR